MNLDDAIQKHADWKIKFRSAISRKEQMDAETIGKDNCCELGKWLHGEGKVLHSKLASFPDLISKHAEFHRQAGKVAKEINAGHYEQAERMLSADTPYGQASSAVGSVIVRLKKEIKS